jgi:hypothetical protein
MAARLKGIHLKQAPSPLDTKCSAYNLRKIENALKKMSLSLSLFNGRRKTFLLMVNNVLSSLHSRRGLGVKEEEVSGLLLDIISAESDKIISSDEEMAELKRALEDKQFLYAISVYLKVLIETAKAKDETELPNFQIRKERGSLLERYRCVSEVLEKDLLLFPSHADIPVLKKLIEAIEEYEEKSSLSPKHRKAALPIKTRIHLLTRHLEKQRAPFQNYFNVPASQQPLSETASPSLS